jgi:hypothetical protein
MATDNLGLTYENRTLQFYGLAYGDSNVSLTATINGSVVFSGEVPTINSIVPPPPIDFNNEVILFSIENSSLFPTNYSGTYPMSIAVSGGYAVVLNNINCNYMSTDNVTATTVMENSSISENVLTVGTVSSGTVAIGQQLTGTNVVANTCIESGSGTTWIVNNSQTVPNTTITGGVITPVQGVANEYQLCYNGNPVNSEATPDPRSGVIIDNIVQVPPLPKSSGVWGWIVPSGSTIAYNLTVSLGNCAQS